jgi:flavorubredoxin
MVRKALRVADQPVICREIVSGIYWLGGCFRTTQGNELVHSHLSCYLVIGEHGAIMIDTGHPKDWGGISLHIRQILSGRSLDYIFPTHQEYPHAGNLSNLLSLFPNAQIVGDVRDLHLHFPECANRLRRMSVGDELDLGDRVLVFLPAIIHDYPSTLWAYERSRRIMFVSDGFGYLHQIEAQCSLLSTELPEPPRAAQALFTLERALYWPKFADPNPVFEELQTLFSKYPTSMVAPGHGNVISNPKELVPLLMDYCASQRAQGRNP